MWSKAKLFFWRTRGVWVTTPAMAGLTIVLRLSGVLQDWEWKAYDLYTRWRPREPVDRRILIVGISEADVSHLQQSILSDGLLAELVKKIKGGRPRAIGLDLYRNVAVPPGERELESVFRTTPNLVGIRKVAGKAEWGETVPPPKILEERGQVGSNDLPVDADNTVRRGLLYLSDGRETYYSLSLHLAGRYLAAEGISPREIPGTQDWQIGKGIFVPFEANDGGYVRADAGGFQFLINYRGGRNTFETVSMTDVLEGGVSPERFRDRIVMIGKVGESFKDIFPTPYSSESGLSRLIPGVEIQANLVSQILSAALEGRLSIRTWPEPVEWLWIFLWSGIGAAIAWQFRYSKERESRVLVGWIVRPLAVFGLFAVTYGAFLQGWWLPAIPAFLALVGSAVAITYIAARSAAGIREIFGRYLTEQIVASILENPDGLHLGGERREITLLTSDLRGFTLTAEKLSPEGVIQILNFYFGQMADAIAKYRGTIDEFMGDGILVLFGAPTKGEDDPARALACAVEMQLAMETVNRQMEAWGFTPLEMGIGINTGEVVVGNIGSEKRTKYGVVGAQVNLTYRIESHTIGGQIFISESTYRQLVDLAIVNEQKEVRLKGIKEPTVIYDVVGIGSPYHLSLRRQPEIYTPIPSPIPVEYRYLEGKEVIDILYRGKLVQLSPRGAVISPESNGDTDRPPGFANLKLNLVALDLSPELKDDIYAKVIDGPAGDEGFYVQFTNEPPAIRFYLRERASRMGGNGDRI